MRMVFILVVGVGKGKGHGSEAEDVERQYDYDVSWVSDSLLVGRERSAGFCCSSFVAAFQEGR